LGVSIAQGNWNAIGFLWGVLIAFCAGAALSGLLVQESKLKLGNRYAHVLLLEAALIVACIPLLEASSVWGVWLAASVCGLQNAMASTYSGSLLRTTHLTGMFTDLGIGLGHLLRGVPLQYRRLTLSGMVISGFLLGSGLGAIFYRPLGFLALLIPAAITAALGVAYIGYNWLRSR